MPLFARGPNGTPEILILHSYTPEFGWTAEQARGISRALAEYPLPYRIYSEFMDWKRFPTPENRARMMAVLLEKFKAIDIDLIITTDDAALDLALEYRSRSARAVPVIFTGVFPETAPALIGEAGMITGVYEELDIAGTIRFSKTVMGSIERVYLVTEFSESGSAVVPDMVRKVVNQELPHAEFIDLASLRLPELEEFVATVPDHSMILLGPFYFDRSLLSWSTEVLVNRLSRASRLPVFLVYTHQFGTGALGGSLLSGEHQGRAAGAMAVRYLSSKELSPVHSLSADDFRLQADYRVLKAYGYPRKLLPAGTDLIHWRQIVWIRYWYQTLILALIFCILLALIISLLVNHSKLSRLARDNIHQCLRINDYKDRLAESEERYRLAAIGSNDALWNWNTDTNYIHYSERWYELTGYNPDLFAPKTLDGYCVPEDKDILTQAIEEHIQGQSDFLHCEIRIRTASGNHCWVLIRGKAIHTADNQTQLAGSITDINERKAHEQEIEQLAFHDALTGLPNRALAQKQMSQALKTATCKKRTGLILLDIDNFRSINETFGHETGDRVIVHAATILSSILHDRVLLSRFGGDEFLIMIRNAGAEEIRKYTQLALRMLGQKIEIYGHQHVLTVTAGVSLYPEHGATFDALLQCSDAALHRAKHSQKNRYLIYDKTMHQQMKERLELENALRSARENSELSVVFQPQINTHTGKIAGFEALARWHPAGRGEIPPCIFIPIAEGCGQIERISQFVITETADFIRRAESSGYRDFTVSVNISAQQVKEENFADKLIREISSGGINAERIGLEITESFLIEDLDAVRAKLNRLRDEGFMISLDDFGRGYSSLSYLKALPIHYIKIDKSFVDDITSSSKDIPLAKAIIAISHQLGLQVVAEGVESADQQEYLSKNECDFIQGFFYSKPVDADTALQLLVSSHS